MTQTKQLLSQMHHFGALQLKEAVPSTKAEIISSPSTWLGEHRGSAAAFPLVTHWVNTLLGIPWHPPGLRGLLCAYPNYAAGWGRGGEPTYQFSQTLPFSF